MLPNLCIVLYGSKAVKRVIKHFTVSLAKEESGSFVMGSRMIKKQFEADQYKDQSDIVYISTIIISAAMALVLFFWIKNTLTAVLHLLSVAVSVVALFKNRQQRYGQGALLYILHVSVAVAIEVMVFGLDAGFQYYYFSLAGLIMFSSWHNWQKVVGVSLKLVLFVVVFFLNYDKTPPVELSYAKMSYLHLTNAIFNIAGVANSANVYISIASRAHRKISALASKDYLTDLMNRTSFDNYMGRRLKDFESAGESLALLFIDIDRFKKINDNCGHLCGDEVLKKVAAILEKSIRAEDCAARYGGEEFVIVVQMDTLKRLYGFAERLRTEVESTDFAIDALTIKITISIGALFVPPNTALSLKDLISQADKLLYQAKARGRNRVVAKKVPA